MARAEDFLRAQLKSLDERAQVRDQPGGERSMFPAVAAFNAMFGHNLTEEEGWQFMVLLKMARAKGGKFRFDDYCDQSGYSALAGEAAERARGNQVEDRHEVNMVGPADTRLKS